MRENMGREVLVTSILDRRADAPAFPAKEVLTYDLVSFVGFYQKRKVSFDGEWDFSKSVQGIFYLIHQI